ncbi:acyl-CoA thioesterase [Thalassotalea euphylliae]|uniref:Acyl-CoA thioesterase n=1 Tax=Thalassotalea euphylliae TaxID=1655234 RepID=A0A3E0TLU1_9GAMM|nr:thioesterase family protein [Thalassotalea euphylliae]REL25524.1 acyl-CoA thioesterase [Thalassotalea euphylliae]
MFTESFTPHFSDTDALGHINNTKVPIWFEGARTPVFRLFTPTLDTANWPLILAKIDVSFEAQMYYGETMEVRTAISRIGGSSFDVYQELWQNGQRVASGTAVMVHFDFKQQKSAAIPENIRLLLTEHIVESSPGAS